MLFPKQHNQTESMNGSNGTREIHEVTPLHAQRHKAGKEKRRKPEHRIMQLITQQ